MDIQIKEVVNALTTLNKEYKKDYSFKLIFEGDSDNLFEKELFIVISLYQKKKKDVFIKSVPLKCNLTNSSITINENEIVELIKSEIEKI